MPGLFSPPIPDKLDPQWLMRALTRVLLWFPGAGWTTIPLGLSITIKSLSSNIIFKSIFSPLGFGSLASGIRSV